MTDSKKIDECVNLISYNEKRNFAKWLEEWHVKKDEWVEESGAKEQERLLKLKIRCDECKVVFKYLDRQKLNVPWHTKHYFADCFPKVKRKYTYICHNCGEEYLYRQERNFCDQCRIYNRNAQSELIQRHKRKSKQKGLYSFR